MKNFIQRNTPIFVIGAFTLVIFIIIITISQLKKQQSPELKPLTSEEITNVETSNSSEISLPTAYETDKKHGIVEITYTLQGFEPKNTKAIQNQLIRWTNKTEIPITLKQITKVYPELNEGIKIEPGKTAEFRLYKPKLWSYNEEDSKQMGTIFVVETQ